MAALHTAIIALYGCVASSAVASQRCENVVARGAETDLNIAAGAGSYVIITTPVAMTSGYSWKIEASQPQHVAPLDSGRVERKTNTLGGVSTFRVRLKVEGKGLSTVRFTMVRPFENAAPADEFSVTIDSRSDPC